MEIDLQLAQLIVLLPILTSLVLIRWWDAIQVGLVASSSRNFVKHRRRFSRHRSRNSCPNNSEIVSNESSPHKLRLESWTIFVGQKLNDVHNNLPNCIIHHLLNYSEITIILDSLTYVNCLLYLSIITYLLLISWNISLSWAETSLNYLAIWPMLN